MSEVAVSKKTSEAPEVGRSSATFRPMFPLGRFSGLDPFALSPFTMMRELASEMGWMFRGNGVGTELQAWAPSVDVQQCDGSLVISADLPGLKKEEVKVEATDDALIIQGERKQEHKEDHEGYHRWERSYGRFYRVIPLPQGARTDQVKAELKDGVLKVSVPAPELKNKARQIPVEG